MTLGGLPRLRGVPPALSITFEDPDGLAGEEALCSSVLERLRDF